MSTNDMDGTDQIRERDYTGAKLGMWLFLFTEVLLFFGPFLLYSVYRYRFGADFHGASRELDLFIGSVNTAILLTSSLTMALSISAMQKGSKGLSVALLFITIALGGVFLANKYQEWMSKIGHGIYPNSQTLLGQSRGRVLFFGLYFFMTGLHGLHVLAGMVVLAFAAVLVITEKITPSDPIKLENAGLYWHLVDVIWIYLFPLFYLVT